MAEKHILHMLTPLPRISPFDANMALDAGFDAVLPYGAVTLEDIGGLVQDAIFSRPPKDGARTGMFIGGKDAIVALDMLDAAKQAMVPPFALSLFADPSGSFTTAAAMVACVRKLLSTEWQRGLDGLKLVVFGATGVVGFASGVIAALEGANVVLAGYDGAARVERSAAEITRRFGVTVRAADASTDDRKSALLRDADAALCAGRAGVQILAAAMLGGAPGLLVVADVNAVPPAGVEGLDAQSNGAPIAGSKTRGIGALAIGGIKYRTEFGLFRLMIESGKPVSLDFRDAFRLAGELVG